jgi:hypothetical protein
MTEEEKKRKFEQDIQRMSIVEYYKYVDDCNKERPKSKVRSEKEAKVFWYAMRLGVHRGMAFMSHQYQQSITKFNEAKQKEKGNETDDR